MRIRWSNVPVPEAYVAAVVAGTILHVVAPARMTPLSTPRLAAGLVLAAAGIALAAWAVLAARGNDLEHPAALVTTGPYALSRNPMYLGWTALCLGLALLVNSTWIAIGVAAAWLYTHLVTIPAEERLLGEQFGQVYEAYRKQVRRYL